MIEKIDEFLTKLKQEREQLTANYHRQEGAIAILERLKAEGEPKEEDDGGSNA